MSQVKKTGPQFDQGEGGGGSTKASGSHLEPAGDVKSQGPTGSHLEPYNITTRSNGSHLDPGPNVPGANSSSTRGGGSVSGHPDQMGSKSSGSKEQQHPNVKK